MFLWNMPFKAIHNQLPVDMSGNVIISSSIVFKYKCMLWLSNKTICPVFTGNQNIKIEEKPMFIVASG